MVQKVTYNLLTKESFGSIVPGVTTFTMLLSSEVGSSASTVASHSSSTTHTVTYGMPSSTGNASVTTRSVWTFPGVIYPTRSFSLQASSLTPVATRSTFSHTYTNLESFPWFGSTPIPSVSSSTTDTITHGPSLTYGLTTHLNLFPSSPPTTPSTVSYRRSSVLVSPSKVTTASIPTNLESFPIIRPDMTLSIPYGEPPSVSSASSTTTASTPTNLESFLIIGTLTSAQPPTNAPSTEVTSGPTQLQTTTVTSTVIVRTRTKTSLPRPSPGSLSCRAGRRAVPWRRAQ